MGPSQGCEMFGKCEMVCKDSKCIGGRMLMLKLATKRPGDGGREEMDGCSDRRMMLVGVGDDGMVADV